MIQCIPHDPHSVTALIKQTKKVFDAVKFGCEASLLITELPSSKVLRMQSKCIGWGRQYGILNGRKWCYSRICDKLNYVRDPLAMCQLMRSCSVWFWCFSLDTDTIVSAW